MRPMPFRLYGVRFLSVVGKTQSTKFHGDANGDDDVDEEANVYYMDTNSMAG